MVQTVTDQDGSVHEFPDDATQEEMKSALAANDAQSSNSPSEKSQSSFLGGLGTLAAPELSAIGGEDTVANKALNASNILMKDVGRGVLNAGSSIVKNAYPALKEEIYNPIQAGRANRAFLGDVAQGALNIPQSIPELMAHLQLISPDQAESMNKGWKAPDIEPWVNKNINPNPSQSDMAIRNLLSTGTMLAPFAGEVEAGASLAKNAVKNLPSTISNLPTATVTNLLGDPLVKAQIKATQGQLPAQETAIQETADKLTAQKEAQKEIQGAAQRSKVAVNPNVVSGNILENRSKVENINDNIKDLSNQLDLHKSLPELPEISNDHVTNLQNAENSANESQNSVDQKQQDFNNAQAQHEEAKEQVPNAENNVAEHLHSGTGHDEEIAARVKPQIKAVQKNVPAAFGKFVDKVADNNVTMPKVALDNYTIDLGKLQKGISEGNLPSSLEEIQTSANPTLDKQLEFAPKPGSTNASDFMLQYRDFREKNRQLQQDMKNEPLASKQNEMYEAWTQSKKVEDVARKALEKGLGDLAPEWKKVNEGYSKVLYPLLDNPVTKEILKHTRISGDIPSKLRGTESGNVTLRNMIKSNPEASQHLVGTYFDSGSPKSFFDKKHPELKEYTDNMPQFQRLMQDRKQAKLAQENAKINANQAKSQLDQAQSRHKEILDARKTAQDNFNRKETEKSGIESEKVERQGQEQKLQSEIDSHKKDIENLNRRIEVETYHRDQLKKQQKNTDLSLKEHIAAKTKFDQSNKKIKDLEQKLYESKGKLGKATTIAGKVALKIGKRILG